MLVWLNFELVPEGGTVVTIGVSECSLVMKAKVMSGKACFTEIRSWVEDGILATHPNLNCSLYVSHAPLGQEKIGPMLCVCITAQNLGPLAKYTPTLTAETKT